MKNDMKYDVDDAWILLHICYCSGYGDVSNYDVEAPAMNIMDQFRFHFLKI